MDSDLHLDRILRAPRALVWDCWTRPELLKGWFCPRPNLVTEATVDLRPGGAFAFALLVEGQTHRHANSYLEVVPGEKLVFTDLMTAGWQPVEKPFLGYTAEVTLADHPQGTRYHVHCRHRSAQAARRHDEMGFSEGWGICADQLQDLADSLGTAGASQLVLTRHLKASPEQVWTAWDDPNVLPGWFGPVGHSCRTKSIDLREGGAWVFDMIGPDGTVYPNRHRFTLRRRPERIEFVMDDGAGNQPKTATVAMAPEAGGTRITMTLTFPDAATLEAARGFGAYQLGMTTLGKLAQAVE